MDETEKDIPYYLQMEEERSKIPNILKADYLPVFVVKVLQEKLARRSEDDGAVVGGRMGRIVRKWIRETEEESMWTDDTWLEENADFEGCFLLTQDERNFAGGVLKFASNAVECMGVTRNAVGKQFSQDFEFPCLELLYMMDTKYKVMPLSLYMLWLTETSQRVYFKRQFLAFAFSPSAFSSDTLDRSTAILHRFLECIMLSYHCNNCNSKELEAIQELCGEILNAITSKLVAENDDRNHKTVLSTIKDLDIPASVRTRFVTEQLTRIFTAGPEVDLLGVIQCQEKYADTKTLISKETLNLTFSEFISMVPAGKILPVISSMLAMTSLNWEYFLHFLSRVFRLHPSSAGNLKELTKSLVRNGLTTRNSLEIGKGFILARHFSLIATESDQFPRYMNWFMNTFQGENHSIAKDPEQFSFLVETLSNWVPVEPSIFLSVHTTTWPFVPKGCRDIWNDYLGIAKVRVREYREVEDAMEYEPNPNDPVQHEVTMALKGFEQTGKLPVTIAKMFIFSRQYYHNDFLPALLRRPSSTTSTDSCIRLIEFLKQQNKIPEEMYATYKAQMKPI